jgi:hypothetical protein
MLFVLFSLSSLLCVNSLGVLGFALKSHSIGLSLEDYSTTISLLKEYHIKSDFFADEYESSVFALRCISFINSLA